MQGLLAAARCRVLRLGRVASERDRDGARGGPSTGAGRGRGLGDFDFFPVGHISCLFPDVLESKCPSDTAPITLVRV